MRSKDSYLLSINSSLILLIQDVIKESHQFATPYISKSTPFAIACAYSRPQTVGKHGYAYSVAICDGVLIDPSFPRSVTEEACYDDGVILS